MRQFLLNLLGHAAAIEAVRDEHQAKIDSLREELDSRRQRITELSEQLGYKSAKLDAVQEQLSKAEEAARKALEEERLTLKQISDSERVKHREPKIYGVGPEPPEPRQIVMPEPRTAPRPANAVAPETIQPFSAWAAATADRDQLPEDLAAQIGITPPKASPKPNGANVVESSQDEPDAAASANPNPAG